MQAWKLVAASTFQIQSWSFGNVALLQDLYDPRIFGPREDLRCECGKEVGERKAGVVCSVCGVVVAKDAGASRKARLGHIDLACPVAHPFDAGAIMDVFPILPIAYRLDQAGTVTAIGRKYESLFELNAALCGRLPPRDSPDYYTAVLQCDAEPLVNAISDVIGPLSPGADPASLDESNLLGLIHTSLACRDVDIAALLRSCGLALELRVTL